MNKIDALKQAVAKLEADLASLDNAERELSNWEDHDLTRRDGSSAQDARNEEMGRDARMRVRDAKHQVDAQKSAVAALTNAI
jgi:hypothetical protein